MIDQKPQRSVWHIALMALAVMATLSMATGFFASDGKAPAAATAASVTGG